MFMRQSSLRHLLFTWYSGSCDTLNNTQRNQEFYREPCQAGRKDWMGMWVSLLALSNLRLCFSSVGYHFKQGMFPASACIKISGHQGESLLLSLSLSLSPCQSATGLPVWPWGAAAWTAAPSPPSRRLWGRTCAAGLTLTTGRRSESRLSLSLTSLLTSQDIQRLH